MIKYNRTQWRLIFKYWLRLVNSENKLLAAAHNSNIDNNKKGKQSWMKIIEHLMKVTNMVEITPPNDIKEKNKIIKTFTKRTLALFEDWWNTQKNTVMPSPILI